MANKESQSPSVVIAGTKHQLRYDYAAMCELCDAIGATVSNMQDVMSNLPVSRMHLMLWAGMLHATPELTPDDVKALLAKESIPDAQAVVMTASAAFNAAMVRPKDAKGAAGDGASPPTPATDPA